MSGNSLTEQPIDLSSLRSKASFQQGEEYLLKLVQAGVGARASAVRIRLLPWEAFISIYAPSSELLDLTVLREHLLEPESFPDTPIRDLALGVLGAAYHPAITLTTNEQILSLSQWDGSLCRRSRPQESPTLEIRIRRGARPGSTNKFGDLFAEHQILLLRCAYAPVPLFLDGVRLSGTRSPFPGVHLAERHWTCPAGGFSLKKPSTAFEIRKQSIVRHHPTREEPQRALLLESDGSEEAPCSVAANLPQDFCGSASVTFIKRGVALDPTLLTGTLAGVRAVADGESLQTHLAGFKALQGDLLQRALADVREKVRATAESVLRLYEDEETSIEWQVDSALVRAKYLMGGVGLLVGAGLGSVIGITTLLLAPLGAYLGVQIASAGDSPEPKFLSRNTLNDKRAKLRNALRVNVAEPAPVVHGELQFDEEIDDGESWTESD